MGDDPWEEAFFLLAVDDTAWYSSQCLNLNRVLQSDGLHHSLSFHDPTGLTKERPLVLQVDGLNGIPCFLNIDTVLLLRMPRRRSVSGGQGCTLVVAWDCLLYHCQVWCCYWWWMDVVAAVPGGVLVEITYLRYT